MTLTARTPKAIVPRPCGEEERLRARLEKYSLASLRVCVRVRVRPLVFRRSLACHSGRVSGRKAVIMYQTAFSFLTSHHQPQSFLTLLRFPKTTSVSGRVETWGFGGGFRLVNELLAHTPEGHDRAQRARALAPRQPHIQVIFR